MWLQQYYHSAVASCIDHPLKDVCDTLLALMHRSLRVSQIQTILNGTPQPWTTHLETPYSHYLLYVIFVPVVII